MTPQTTAPVGAQPAPNPNAFTAEHVATLESKYGVEEDVGIVTAKFFSLAFRRPSEPEFLRYKTQTGSDKSPTAKAVAQADMARACCVGVARGGSVVLGIDSATVQKAREALAGVSAKWAGVLDGPGVSKVMSRFLHGEAEEQEKD